MLVPKANQISKREWLSEEAIEIARERRIAQSNIDLEETRKLNADFQRQVRKDKEECFTYLCKELKEDIGKGDTRRCTRK